MGQGMVCGKIALHAHQRMGAKPRDSGARVAAAFHLINQVLPGICRFGAALDAHFDAFRRVGQCGNVLGLHGAKAMQQQIVRGMGFAGVLQKWPCSLRNVAKRLCAATGTDCLANGRCGSDALFQAVVMIVAQARNGQRFHGRMQRPQGFAIFQRKNGVGTVERIRR